MFIVKSVVRNPIN